MKNGMSELEAMALAMHYYAYLNEQDVVETIVALPSVISHPQYIAISSNDESLIGKKYNRGTGEFEDVMFYYAVLDEKDVVVQVVALESKVADEKKIEIPNYDQSLVGKWYNRKKGAFSEPPIHIIAKANTGEINTLKADGSPEDKWLHTELSDLRTKISEDDQALYTELGKVRTEISKGDQSLNRVINILDTRISEVGKRTFGAYKTSFKLKNNEMMTSEWVHGKRLTFNFDTGIPGYFPKMIRLMKGNGNDFIADLYIAKNTDGTIKRIYFDENYIGVDYSDQIQKRYFDYDKNADSAPFLSGHKKGRYYNQGGEYFVGTLPDFEYSEFSVDKFIYDENSISFSIYISEELIGRYTRISLDAYVY